MNLGDIQQVVRAERSRLNELGVESLHVFGSVARGEASEHSDVDLVVRFDRPATFDRFMTLKLLLEDGLGRPVDLVTERALRPELRHRILAEATRVA